MNPNKVRQSIKINAPQTKVFDVLVDFENYPIHQPAVETAKVIKQTKNAARVAFTLKLITKVHYTLDFKLKPPCSITWETYEGDSILKSNTGRWQIDAAAKGVTDLTCEMETIFNLWIPSAITNKLTSSYLPNMLKHFKIWAEDTRFGR